MDLAGNFTTSIGGAQHSPVPSLAESQKVQPLASSHSPDFTGADRSAGVIFESSETKPTHSTYSINTFTHATEGGAFAPIAAVERTSFADARERAGAIHELVAEFVNGSATFGANDD